MTAAEWHGVFPYLVSPVDADGTPNVAMLTKLVEYAIECGVHGLTPLGSSGEFPYFSEGARRTIIDATVVAAAGRVPVVPGIGGFSVEETVRQARYAEAAGADGVLFVPQAFSPLADSEVIRFVDATVNSVGVPVVLYHNPPLCGVRLSPGLVGKLVERCGLRYVKDASGDLNNIDRWRDAGGSRLRIFSATAVSPTAAMLLGTVGWMSGPACAFPAESVAIYEACREGHWEQARIIERAIEPALESFRVLGPCRGAKALVTAMGFAVGQPIAPIDPLSADDLDKGRACVAEVKRRLAEIGFLRPAADVGEIGEAVRLA